MFVPLKTKTLYGRYYEGRLIARGSPLSVEISHLREQFLNNFPPVNQEEPEPQT